MNQPFGMPNSQVEYGAVTQVRNRVLRNTYWLLALSMIPTILGAYVGIATGMATALSGITGLIVFFAGAFGFMYAIEKTKNSGMGVVLLLAFTFFMGVMLSRLVGVILGMGNGTQLVMTAFAGTAAVFATMATVATTTKRDFSGAGKWLMVGMIVILVTGLLNAFVFQSTAMMAALSAAAIALFSFWLMYDIKRIVDGGETNYISATLSLYLSVFNIFQNLLVLLGVFGGDD
ncbi:BAX inhibitor (BI)-1/YccA family protein [Lampropedia puyangensis]|uniref:BAX inhibitor (BI)-1/YccA family protein n=1 Tax=Lampropedia puyangensis TaxID=1330072 RepID=A0A4V4GQ20_9BURK|nr:Bax inhibitor-1 family protein [Lampropedia puyangensis]THT96065.1 BAX inhibitor (BI)-1/YccA family protein [Lampropedia puyangensis]